MTRYPETIMNPTLETTRDITQAAPRTSIARPIPRPDAYVRTSGFDLLYLVDWMAALALAVLSLPTLTLAVIWVLIVDWGNPFFVQTRVGLNGEPYRMFKIRSMYRDHHGRAKFCAHGDSRIIPGGRILRNYRIDEIPQFLNVLLGDMALVGPRPEQVPFVATFLGEIPDYGKRFMVKPGITGLAQTTQGYVDSLEGTRIKLKYDLEFIDKRSFRCWLGIVLKTVEMVVFKVGAR